MNKVLQNTIIVGIIIVTLSVAVMALSLVYIPQTEFDACYNKCSRTELAQSNISCVVICGKKYSN